MVTHRQQPQVLIVLFLISVFSHPFRSPPAGRYENAAALTRQGIFHVCQTEKGQKYLSPSEI